MARKSTVDHKKSNMKLLNKGSLQSTNMKPLIRKHQSATET